MHKHSHVRDTTRPKPRPPSPILLLLDTKRINLLGCTADTTIHPDTPRLAHRTVHAPRLRSRTTLHLQSPSSLLFVAASLEVLHIPRSCTPIVRLTRHPVLKLQSSSPLPFGVLAIFCISCTSFLSCTLFFSKVSCHDLYTIPLAFSRVYTIGPA